MVSFTDYIPQLSAAPFITGITIFVIIFILVVIGAFIFYFLYQYYLYNLVVWDIEGGRVVSRSKARKIKVGKMGEELIQLKRGKSLRIGFGKTVGRNIYAFTKGKDGIWYNVDFEGDFDQELKKVGLKPVHTDIRLAYVAAGKMIDAEFNKKSFFEKYGSYIFMFVTLTICFVGLWFVVKQEYEIFQKIPGMIDQMNELAKTMKEASLSLDNAASTLKTGGSLLKA